MCAVSMIGDHFTIYTLPHRHNWVTTVPSGPTKTEFDALKRDVEDLKDLLKRAKEYDERTGQPDCEMDEKAELLRKVAKLVGIELGDVLGNA